MVSVKYLTGLAHPESFPLAAGFILRPGQASLRGFIRPRLLTSGSLRHLV